MPEYVYSENNEKKRTYIAIKCFTCNRFLLGKSELENHKNHDVHYTDLNGNLDE